jgi:SNF family Na+-dependent transporter
MIGMPLLIGFGIILAVRGLMLGPGDPGVVQSPLEGLNFVWNPQMSGLVNPTTWLAAAGQIFFTLSVGMGSIHCYAAYVREKHDIALNAASAGWMNEFVEVILGGTILIPISTAYLGLQTVQAMTSGGGGFGLGFMSLPTLFNNWGWFAPVAGAMWFGLLFFAGITSSLAMGQPVMAFLQDEFNVPRTRSAILVGTATLLLGGFTVWLYPGGAHDEFDFWTGTFSLVVFAVGEALVFAWVFGMDRGWEEITRGADMKVPRVFRFVIKWVTPLFLLVIFVASLVKPSGEWGAALGSLLSGDGWPWAPDSVVGKVLHVGDERYRWFDDDGYGTRALVQDVTRLLLMTVFAACGWLIWRAWRLKEGRRA